jgi:hypothetical protein
MAISKLSETQRSTIVHALRVAADSYGEHVKTLQGIASETGGSSHSNRSLIRLSEQFERQASDSLDTNLSRAPFDSQVCLDVD